jgi:hypothetical protein
LSRAQGDYLGRGAAVRTGGAQDYGGPAVRTGDPRGMVAGNYGTNRAEAELVAQYGGAGGGRNAVGAAGGGAGAAGATGYGGNQQASVYGGMSGGRGPAGTLPRAYHAALSLYGCNTILFNISRLAVNLLCFAVVLWLYNLVQMLE